MKDPKAPDTPGQRLAASLLDVLGSKNEPVPVVRPPAPRVIEVTGLVPPDRSYVSQPGEEEEPSEHPPWEPKRATPFRSRRHFSEQVKADAVALALSIGRGGAAEAARRYNVSDASVSAWIKAAQQQQQAQAQAKPAQKKKGEPVTLTITINGLDDYIDRRVDERLLRRLRKLLGEDE